MNIVIISLCAFLATFLGGMFAFRIKDKLHLVLGFSAGAVIAVAFFDLMPEALNLGALFGAQAILGIVALGFFVFMILDRFVILHIHHTDHDHGHIPKRGRLGATSLSIHSFLDGLAIGLAFQVSVAIGVVIATAVLVHDFSDGINTVNLIIKNGGTSAQARRWLFVDAITPVFGVIATFFFHVPESILGIILAVFSGFFLYIGASDLLPESHHNHPTIWTTVATLLGAGILFIAIHIAG